MDEALLSESCKIAISLLVNVCDSWKASKEPSAEIEGANLLVSDANSSSASPLPSACFEYISVVSLASPMLEQKISRFPSGVQAVPRLASSKLNGVRVACSMS